MSQTSFDNQEQPLPLEFKGTQCFLLLWNLLSFWRFGYDLRPWRMRCFIMLSDQFFWLFGSTKSSVLHHITFRYVNRWLSNKQNLMLQNCIAIPRCISGSLSILNFMSPNNLFLPEELHSYFQSGGMIDIDLLACRKHLIFFWKPKKASEFLCVNKITDSQMHVIE